MASHVLRLVNLDSCFPSISFSPYCMLRWRAVVEDREGTLPGKQLKPSNMSPHNYI